MLQQLSIYLLKVTCISGLLFLYYHIALRNKRFHYYNRFYLLMAVALSIVLPLLQLQWFTFFSDSDQTIHLYKIISGSGENEIAVTGKAGINWEQLALYGLAVASIFLLAVFCSRILKIKLLKKKYPVQQFTEFDFVHTDISSAPFSFLKDIFWRNDINLENETGKQILQHEITHIRQKHSWDKLFMQFTLCFYWMNPFFHLIKKELYLIHEFIADEEAVKHADADAFARMLLTAQFGKFNFLPAQSIFYSSIKRRLTMLTTSKKPQFSYARRLMVLPLTAALVCLFAFTVKTRNANSTIPPTVLAKPFVLVVDAGHGGKDNGALGNGMYEKDAALKIAKKIKDLSTQYNIDVILTRNSDVFMDPKQKSDFANAQNANAFISIHVNTNDKEHPDQSGFEVLLSNNNEKFAAQNKVLGSAILQNLSKDFTAATDLKISNVGIWVLKNTNTPSALIECGYITNKTDVDNLKDDAKLELMAKNILAGVAAFANQTSISIRDTIPANIINVNADKQPLYVVNGKPSSKVEIKLIDEADIERVDVLKDSASRVIYGPKAEKGVVLITLKTSAKQVQQPLYVLDDKIISKEEMKKIKPDNIQSIDVLKGKSGTDKYGDKGKNGVVKIQLKKFDKVEAPPANALYVLDGNIISKEEAMKIDGANIKRINVLKDKYATDKYGDKGKNGVVEMTSKKDAYEKPLTIGGKVPENVLYILDGKVATKNDISNINANNIQSINVLKGESGTIKYGDKGKHGVIEITLKDQKQSSLNNDDKLLIAVSDTNPKHIFTDVQIQPQFPGGDAAWSNYLAKQLDASVLAKKSAPAGVYTVTLSFIVNENGTLSDIKALNDPGYGAAAEAVRVLKQGPKWLPAIQNGQKVAFANKQKIIFKIS